MIGVDREVLVGVACLDGLALRLALRSSSSTRMARGGGSAEQLLERAVRAGVPGPGFASFRGQRNRPGLWWFATTGEHVGHESLAGAGPADGPGR